MEHTRFHIILPRILLCADQLERIASIQRASLDDLRMTRASLAGLSGMDHPLAMLRRRQEMLEETIRRTRDMAQCLRQVCHVFSEAEQGVVDGLDFQFTLSAGDSLYGGPGGAPPAEAWFGWEPPTRNWPLRDLVFPRLRPEPVLTGGGVIYTLPMQHYVVPKADAGILGAYPIALAPAADRDN